jgi:hypothetical protein
MSDSIMIKAYCDWQIFGDVEPAQHLHDLLAPWIGRGADGADGDLDEYLDDLTVTFADDSGPFGLRYVQFTIRTPLQPEALDKAKLHIKNRLDRMVGDTDVSVRWLMLAQ